MNLNFALGTPFNGHSGCVLGLSFSKVLDGVYYMASVGRDGKGIVRRSDTGDIFKRLVGHQDAVRGVALSANATIVATGSNDCTARIWGVSSGKELSKFQQCRKVTSVALDSGSVRMLTSSQERETDICLYDLNQGQECLRVYQKKKRGVRNVIFCRDDRSFLTSSYDRTIELWDIAGGQKSHNILLPHHAKSMELCADGKTVAISFGKSVVFFDADTFKVLGHLKMPSKVFGASLHPEKKSFVCANTDGMITKFDFETGELKDQFPGHLQMRHRITGIKYSPDGETYVGMSTNGQIRLWPQSCENWNNQEAEASPSSSSRSGGRDVISPIWQNRTVLLEEDTDDDEDEYVYYKHV